jgi:hypothetical protein
MQQMAEIGEEVRELGDSAVARLAPLAGGGNGRGEVVGGPPETCSIFMHAMINFD